MQTKFSHKLLFSAALFPFLCQTTAQAALAPISFGEMYHYAARGNLRMLNNAIMRGLNINAANANGDTAVCVAIRRNDQLAYRTLKNAGADTRPGCIGNINSAQYRKFMAVAEPVTAARTRINPVWLWTGGIAGAGAIALAAGGGGGGGGGSDATPPKPADPDFHTDKGLGYVAGQTEPSEPEGETYTPVLVSAKDDITEVNREELTLSNNSNLWIYSDTDFNYKTLALADLVSFDTDINKYTKYLQIGMKAENKSNVINDNGQNINLGNNTIALNAVLNSSASNLGTIEIQAQNGTIGMVASDYSSAGNNGIINIGFTGTATHNQIIGMYADTNSSAVNKGTISATAESALGKITGMQTRLTNYYADFNNQASNNGTIDLNGSRSDGEGLSLWGMSSWLDQAFLDGSQSAQKLDKAVLKNSGTINLTLAIGSGSEDGPAVGNSLSLDGGDGGVVGIHADANTTAANNGDITVTITGDTGQSVAAGMQSVRGGVIANNKNITVSAEGTAYGMMAVSGNGSSENFADVSGTLTNKGTIGVTAADTAFGIYSDVNGVIENQGNIVIDGNGYGIYKENGTVTGNGSIAVNGAGAGIYGRNSTITAGGSIKIDSNNLYSAYGINAVADLPDAEGSMEKPAINNSAAITMTFTAAESDGDGEEGDALPAVQNYGISAQNTDVKNSGSVTLNMLAEQTGNLFGIYADNGNIDNEGKITLNGYGSGLSVLNGNLKNKGAIIITTNDLKRSYGIYAQSAAGGSSVENSGNIELLSNTTIKNNVAYGIYSAESNVTNSGKISIGQKNVFFQNAFGMAVENADIVNSGSISLYGSGYGMKALNGNLTNNQNADISVFSDNSANSYGISISGTGKKLVNDGNILISSTASEISKAMHGIISDNADINNSGNIRLGDTGILFSDGTGIFNDGGNTDNSGNINLYGSGYGIKSLDGTISNRGNINILTDGTSASYGIYAVDGDTLANSGQINISSTQNEVNQTVYGIYAGIIPIENSGDIKIGDNNNLFNKAYGIAGVDFSDIVNTASIRLYGSGAAITSDFGNITNNANGNITVITNGAASSYGIYLAGNNSQTLINNGIIKINKAAPYSSGHSHAALWADKAAVNNSGSLEIGAAGNEINGSSAIEIHNGTVTNAAQLIVYGNGKGINAVNSNVQNNEGGNISIMTTGNTNSYGIYSAGGTLATTINNLASISVTKNQTNYTAVGGIYGIFSENAVIDNRAEISLGSSTANMNGLYGLYSDNGNINNSGILNLYGSGVAIYAVKGSVNNLSSNGIINIVGNGENNNYGIYAPSDNDNLITNQNRISMTLKEGTSQGSSAYYGISGKNVNNAGTIQIGSTTAAINNSYAIYGTKQLTNSGSILLYGSNNAGIYSHIDNSYINNSGNITLSNCSNGHCQGIAAANGATNVNILNTGAISVESSSSASYGIYNISGLVTNRGSIIVDGASSYGIKARGIYNYGEIKLSLRAGYALATESGTIKNYGDITANGDLIDGIYGSGSATTFENEGNIDITGSGSWGIRSGANNKTTNKGSITMRSEHSYGIHLAGGSAVNSGTITMNGSNSYGIYANNVQLDNSGHIVINGADSYGIFAIGSSNVTNSGDIYLNSTASTETAAALYAGENAKITNEGDLYIKDSANSHNWAAYTSGSGQIINTGTIYVASLSDAVISGNVTNNGTVKVGSGILNLEGNMKFSGNSKFIADEIKGEALVAAETVQQSNKTRFVLEDNFEGKTDELSVKSESYLFQADFDGGKTTLTMKDFAEVEDNESVAAFLQNNYVTANNAALFDDLKTASRQDDLTGKINRRLGLDSFPSFARQNLDLIKDLNRQINNNWFNAAEQNRSFAAGISYYNRDRDADRRLSGSTEDAVSIFGILRNTDKGNISYGIGWSITQYNSKYDNDGKRNETIGRVIAPFGWKYNADGSLFSTLYAGYGNGEYKRHVGSERYRSNLQNYYYGMTNEWRHNIAIGNGFALQPTAEFNLAGLYQSGIHDQAIRIKHNNNLSIENGLGLYLQKEFAFAGQNKLQVRAGASWYHEFNDRYQTVKAQLQGMDGSYAMDKLSTEKDRGLANLNAEYTYGSVSLFGNAGYHWQNDDAWSFNAGIKYAF